MLHNSRSRLTHFQYKHCSNWENTVLCYHCIFYIICNFWHKCEQSTKIILIKDSEFIVAAKLQKLAICQEAIYRNLMGSWSAIVTADINGKRQLWHDLLLQPTGRCAHKLANTTQLCNSLHYTSSSAVIIIIIIVEFLVWFTKMERLCNASRLSVASIVQFGECNQLLALQIYRCI